MKRQNTRFLWIVFLSHCRFLQESRDTVEAVHFNLYTVRHSETYNDSRCYHMASNYSVQDIGHFKMIIIIVVKLSCSFNNNINIGAL